jgi:uncharacterized protein YdaU (DUF1376 family)
MSRWYKRCGADFIAGTMKLTLEEKGAYSLCLDLIYDRGGPIPDDARWLSGVCGVSIRKWNALRESLIRHGKIVVEGDTLTNARAAFELVSAEFQRRNQAESGAKGGRKRAENEAALKQTNGLGQATLKPIEEKRIDKSDDDARAKTAPSDALDLTAEVCRVAGIRHIDPGHIVSRVPVIREWLQAGADPLLILATVRDLTAATTEPIRSLNFIDPHIRKAITRKENPNAQPTATGQPGRNPAQPSGRTATVLKLLAESRASAPTNQPGDNGIAGRIGDALPQG